MSTTVQTEANLDTSRSKPFRVKEVADVLDVDLSTVYVAIRTGQLASYRVGAGRGTIRIPRSALKTYADERGIPVAELGVEL
jgi:excisionase family DNA binding protein